VHIREHAVLRDLAGARDRVGDLGGGSALLHELPDLRADNVGAEDRAGVRVEEHEAVLGDARADVFGWSHDAYLRAARSAATWLTIGAAARHAAVGRPNDRETNNARRNARTSQASSDA